MSTTTSANLGTLIVQSVEGAIKEAINQEFDRAVKEAVEAVESKRNEILAKTVIELSTWMTMEDSGRTIRIEVKKPELRGNND